MQCLCCSITPTLSPNLAVTVLWWATEHSSYWKRHDAFDWPRSLWESLDLRIEIVEWPKSTTHNEHSAPGKRWMDILRLATSQDSSIGKDMFNHNPGKKCQSGGCLTSRRTARLMMPLQKIDSPLSHSHFARLMFPEEKSPQPSNRIEIRGLIFYSLISSGIWYNR